MSTKKKKIFSYNVRLIMVIVPLILSITLSCLYFDKAIRLNEQKRFSYVEIGTVNYKVRLRDNDFYDRKVLNQDMSYIANLIDKIRVNFNYDFKYDKKINNKYTYDIVGILEIDNPDTNEKFLLKEYNLMSEKKINNFDRKNYNISESILVDYQLYNKISNDFKKNFKVNTVSKFSVILRVKRDISNDIEQPKKLTMEIPLTDKAVSINAKRSSVDKKDTIITNKKLVKKERTYLLKGFVFLGISVLIIVSFRKVFFRLYIVPSKYEESLNRIRREYDRLLIEVTRLPKMDDYTITDINEFEELVDLVELYGELIRIREDKKNNECLFYVVHKKEIYIYALRKNEKN